MFRENDKLNLVLTNSYDINEKYIPYSIKLPLESEQLTLPENLVSIDLFEYQEGTANYGNIVYHIYIGEKTTFNNLIEEISSKTVTVKKGLHIPSLDSEICYQETQDNTKEKTIFAVLNEQDVVVENKEQLIELIKSLSESFNCLQHHISNIKKIQRKKL